jgi:hypothetical protein
LHVFFGHHKAASTWIFNLCSAICERLDLSFEANPELGNGSHPTADFLAFGNASIEQVQKLGDFRGFHVIRDPRDIVVSAYFSHKYSHPMEDYDWLSEARTALQAMQQEEGIRYSIDWRYEQFSRMGNWPYSDRRIYESRFETLTRNPDIEFRNIFKFLGLYPDPLNPALLSEILDAHSFVKLSGGRPIGTEDIMNHYRKGMAGDWVNYLQASNKEYFKERYGYLLIDLGYEEDMDW